MKATIEKVDKQGALIRYRVDVGKFTVWVLLLNVQLASAKTGRKELYSTHELNVAEVPSVSSENYISKRTYFTTAAVKSLNCSADWGITDIPWEIEGVVCEYAMGKICAALGVGIKVGSPDHPFDLVCYQDCVEFFMEKGQPIESLQFAVAKERLQYCVFVMHRFGLIHKDIKPKNMLVGRDGQAVLCDFGISTHIRESPGQTTFTYREGTQHFKSPAMLSLNFS